MQLRSLIDGDICLYKACHFGGGDFLKTIESIDDFLLFVISRFPGGQVFLTGPGNFRYNIAKTKPYKGNRKNRKKPLQFDNLREYVIENWNPDVSHGVEADDRIAMSQTNETIIVSTDKDMMQIAGWHYNPVENNQFFVTEDDGMRFFWYQMLVGDAIDNIDGVRGLGEAKVSKLFDGVRTKELKSVVIEQYKRVYKEEWVDKFDEMASLLWIIREEGKAYIDYI